MPAAADPQPSAADPADDTAVSSPEGRQKQAGWYSDAPQQDKPSPPPSASERTSTPSAEARRSENSDSARGSVAIPHEAAPTARSSSDTSRSRASGNGDATSSETDLLAGAELAIVCSHYDLGTIDAIVPFQRGAAHTPKVVLKTRQRGEYLLKRRSGLRTDAKRLASIHRIQLHLAQHGYPVPSLIGTRQHRQSVLTYGGARYEVSRFIRGAAYDKSAAAGHDAGRVLAWLHASLTPLNLEMPNQPRGYHGQGAQLQEKRTAVRAALKGSCTKDEGANVDRLLSSLVETYGQAEAEADGHGFGTWPRIIVHGDWHPGNLLFNGARVVGVLDFDSARIEPRATDIANGALQFALISHGDDLGEWPDELDETLLAAFCAGYDAYSPAYLLSQAEIRAMPYLMIEAFIIEAFCPIAETGRFARYEGAQFLEMVRRKVNWIGTNAAELSRLIDG